MAVTAIALDQELRSQGIGASEIAAVVGLDPYDPHALKLYQRKVGGDSFAGNRVTAWGNRLEPVIREVTAEQTGLVILPSQTLQHPKHKIAIATPDGLVYDNGNRLVGVHQIKTTSNREEWGEPGTDEVPERTIAQVTWELLVVRGVTGVDVSHAYVTPLFLGEDFRRSKLPVYIVKWDAEFAGSLLASATAFWEKHVAPRIPPEVQPGDAQYRDYLKARFPRPNGQMLQADDATINLMLAYDRACAAENDAKAEKEQAAAALCAVIGEAEGVEAVGVKATWKWQKGSTYTVNREPQRVLRVTVKSN